MTSAADLDTRAELLRLLGHPMRLCILDALTGRERAVGDVAEHTGLGLSALSQQLALLRKAGLVTARREAKQVFYAIDHSKMDVVRQIINGLSPAGGVEAAGSAQPVPMAKAGVGAAMFARVIPARV